MAIVQLLIGQPVLSVLGLKGHCGDRLSLVTVLLQHSSQFVIKCTLIEPFTNYKNHFLAIKLITQNPPSANTLQTSFISLPMERKNQERVQKLFLLMTYIFN